MSYEKKTWVTGETITADGLNNLENGIADIPTLTITWDDTGDNTVATIPKAEVDFIVNYLPARVEYDDGESASHDVCFFGGMVNGEAYYLKIATTGSDMFTLQFTASSDVVYVNSIQFTPDGDVYKYVDEG